MVKEYGYTYKGLSIIWSVDDRGMFHTNALGFLSCHNKKDINGCYETRAEAKMDIEHQVDDFLNTAPETWRDLADAITETLIWDGYESAFADDYIVKQLVVAFLRSQGIEIEKVKK